MNPITMVAVEVIISAVLSVAVYKLHCLSKSGAVASFAVGTLLAVFATFSEFFIITFFVIMSFFATMKDIDKKTAALKRINDAIDAMWNENERTVLILRYKHSMTFEQIAEEMDYSWRHTLRIHGSALQHFMEGR